MINQYDYWSLHYHTPVSTSTDSRYHPISIISIRHRYSNRWAVKIIIAGPSDLTISNLLLPRCAASSSLSASISRNGRRAIRSCWIRCCCSIWTRRSCTNSMSWILSKGSTHAGRSPRQRSGRLIEGYPFKCLWRRLRRNCCLCGLLCSWECICFRNRTFASISRIHFRIRFYPKIFIRICNAAFYWIIISYAQLSLSFYSAYRNLFWICKWDGISMVRIVYSIRNNHHRDNSFLFVLRKLWKIIWIIYLLILYRLMALLLGLINIVIYFT